MEETPWDKIQKERIQQEKEKQADQEKAEIRRVEQACRDLEDILLLNGGINLMMIGIEMDKNWYSADPLTPENFDDN